MGMEDFIDVPDSFSSFRNDMEGDCKAVISKCELKLSKTGNKYIMVRYVLTEAAKDEWIGQSTIESFVLTPKALWRLNDLYRIVSDSNLPPGRKSIEELMNLMEEDVIGREIGLTLATTLRNDKQFCEVINKYKA